MILKDFLARNNCYISKIKTFIDNEHYRDVIGNYSYTVFISDDDIIRFGSSNITDIAKNIVLGMRTKDAPFMFGGHYIKSRKAFCFIVFKYQGGWWMERIHSFEKWEMWLKNHWQYKDIMNEVNIAKVMISI